MFVWELTSLRLSSPLELLLGLSDVRPDEESSACTCIHMQLTCQYGRIVHAFKNICLNYVHMGMHF